MKRDLCVVRLKEGRKRLFVKLNGKRNLIMAHIDGHYKKIPLNTTEIEQAELNITNKFRSNPFRWNGQFSPQLIQVLIKKYSTPKTVVFDPFLGSGTTLLEAGLAGISAKGVEINPAAFILSQTYKMINVSYDERIKNLKNITTLLEKSFIDSLPLFESTEHKTSTDIVKEKLLNILYEVNDILQFQLVETLIILLDFYKPGLSPQKVISEWTKLKDLVLRLPFSIEKVEMFNADARKTPLEDYSVDLVITSPPYINVHNYHQQYRASVETIYNDILKIAQSEIGSNRKHRSNRFLTVIQYCLDMALTFKELLRVCRKESRIIFIVGRESSIRSTSFYNGEIVTEVAYRATKMNLILKQQRVFRNRFGNDIYEDILHFRPNNNIIEETILINAREVAKDILEASYFEAPEGVKYEIQDAINNIHNVKPSPYFDKNNIGWKIKKELVLK